MRTRVLGRTAIEVSELALGGLFVSKVGGDFEQGRKAILRAIELGVNYVDTAPGYADSEAVIGRVLPEIEAPLVLSTKLGGRPQPFMPQDRDCLMASIEESLRLLHRETIDILMIHEPDRPGQYDWWPDLDTYEAQRWYRSGHLRSPSAFRLAVSTGGQRKPEPVVACAPIGTLAPPEASRT